MPPAVDCLNRGDDLRLRRTLQQIALRASFDCTIDLFVGLVTCQHNSSGRYRFRANRFQQLDTCHARHPQIEQQDIGLLAIDELERLFAGGSRTGDDKARNG